MPKKMLVVGAVLALLTATVLSACSVSLAADVTPPPTYKSPTPPAVQAASLPQQAPNPANGAALYAEKCAPCHGNTGMGDGSQAAQLSIKPPAIGSPDVVRNARPDTWYGVITNGNMQNFMPPFKNGLTDQQRWDVLAYVLSMAAKPADLQQAKSIYDQKCASCHGDKGKGDGAASSAARMPNWSDASRLVTRSNNDLFKVISNGSSPAMPAFSSQYSEAERWALAAYVRAFSFGSSAPAPAAVTTPATGQSTPAATGAVAQATPAAGQATPVAGTPAADSTLATFKVNVSGKVTPPAGTSLPEGLKLMLDGYDNMMPTWSQTVDVQADGSYRINDVEVVSGRTFMATVIYKNVGFTSDPLHAADLKAGQDVTLPVALADVTTDVSGITSQRMHVFFDFSTAGIVQVAELFVLQNPGTKAVAPSAADKPVINFVLPQGAQNLFFEDGQLGDGHYVKTDNGFGDMTPILPSGQLQVLFGYEMPYTNNQQSLSIPLTVPVQSVVVMVPNNGVGLQSSQLTSAGDREVQGVTIKLFTASDLPAGGNLDLTLSGKPADSVMPGGTTATTTTNSTDLVVAIAVFGVALIGAGVLLYRRRGQRQDEVSEEGAETEAEGETGVEEESPEALLDAIVALDDLYQAGELPETAYQERRAALKARLAAMKRL